MNFVRVTANDSETRFMAETLWLSFVVLFFVYVHKSNASCAVG